MTLGVAALAASEALAIGGGALAVQTGDFVFPAGIAAIGIVLLLLSAFFSGSETALFSIQQVRLRGMRAGNGEERGVADRLVTQLMDHPGRLLTTILVGNTIVNILIGIFLGSRMDDALQAAFGLQPGVAYVAAVALCTAVLLLFGEIAPKVVAVHLRERLARVVAFPLILIVRLLSPICTALLWFTDTLFRVTHFHNLRASPFLTDDELKSALSVSEAEGVIEEDERQMIQGILEFSDALLREILVPRPDVVALAEDATVRCALAKLREHEYSRMPIYREDLDHVTGILVAKDLLSSVAKGELDRPVRSLGRPAQFVPETMTVQQFVKDAQRRRVHLAVVVDEYGGTSGIVTLEDAIEEVVGDIMDEGEQDEIVYEKIGDGVFRVDGNMSLDELSELIGIAVQDEEHETVAGFLMDKTEKILEPGDQIEHARARFTVEACKGKRASSVRIELLPLAEPEEDAP